MRRLRFNSTLIKPGPALESAAVAESKEYSSTGLLASVRATPSSKVPDAPVLPTELSDMAMYVPELVLRQYVDGSPPEMPKLVTLHGSVLFADVSGFTKLTALLQASSLGPARGAEELNNILSEYFDILITCFHRHGGDVISFSGDAMTVLFEADAVGGVPPTEEAMALAALQSVRCAAAVLKAVDGFSLARYAQKTSGIEGCQITLHAGMGVGTFTALYVAGHKRGGGGGDGGGGGEPGKPSSPSRQESTVTVLERDGFAMMGSPMTQLKHAEEKAGSGECVLSPQLWALVKPHCTAAKEDADGFAWLGDVASVETDAERPPTRRELALYSIAENAADVLGGCVKRVSAFNPEPVQHRLRVTGKNWLADFRVVSIMFMRIKTVSHDTPNVLDECAKCFRLMHETLTQYGGMMARFNVDDKGTIMFAAFGPPPTQHEDGPVRAVRSGVDIVEKIEKIGHTVRVGITTGNVYAGSVGNEHRCEYTFYGTTVNMAARLMVNGANEGVLVDEQTYRDAHEQVRLEALPPITVKGRDEPMAVFRPHSKGGRGADGTARVGAAGGAGGGVSTPRRAPVAVQGRKAERRRLQSRMESASRGEGGFVLVEGAAGMGKTVLLRDLEKLSVPLNLRVLKGSCSAIDEATPLFVFSSVMGQLLEDATPAMLSGHQKNLVMTQSLHPASRSAAAGEKLAEDLRAAGSALGGGGGGGGGGLGGSLKGSSNAMLGGAGAFGQKDSAVKTIINVNDARQKGVRELLSNSEMVREMPLLAPLLNTDIPHNRYTVRVTAEKRQEKLLGLCVQLLREKCRAHRTILLPDNVQWMDEVSWTLVRRLSAELSELLIIACIRKDGGGATAAAWGDGGGGGGGGGRTSFAQATGRLSLKSTRKNDVKQAQAAFLRELESEHPDAIVRLEPLLEADLTQMSEKLLGVKAIPPALSAFLLSKSEGNPFYVIEIMAFLRRNGMVRVSSDASKPVELGGVGRKDTESADEFNKRKEREMDSEFTRQFESTGVHRLLIAQVESLPGKTPQEKANLEQILKSASALGESFQSRPVRDIHTRLKLEPAASQVDKYLSKLRELKLFEYNSELNAYSFRSSIMQDVIYTSLTFENRKMLHTAAADNIVEHASSGGGGGGGGAACGGSGTAKEPTQYLKALQHLLKAENEPKVLALVTDAAQQAMAGCSWNEALDVIDLGDDLVREHHEAVEAGLVAGGGGGGGGGGGCGGGGVDEAMAAAVEALPAGTLVLWNQLRGEAMLGLDLTELAYAKLKEAFRCGLDEAGIGLVAVERDGKDGKDPKEGKPRKGLIGKMFGGGGGKKDGGRGKDSGGGAGGGGVDEAAQPGLRHALTAHTTLCRALMEGAAERALALEAVVAELDKHGKLNEHLRASLAAAAALPSRQQSVERVLTQAFGALYLALQLRSGGLDAAAVKAAKPTLDPLLSALADFSSNPLFEAAGGGGGTPQSRPASAPTRDTRVSNSSSVLSGSSALNSNGSSSPASLSSLVSPTARTGSSTLLNLELTHPSLHALVHLALALGPSSTAEASAASVTKASALAAEADDKRLQKICEHFGGFCRTQAWS